MEPKNAQNLGRNSLQGAGGDILKNNKGVTMNQDPFKLPPLDVAKEKS